MCTCNRKRFFALWHPARINEYYKQAEFDRPPSNQSQYLLAQGVIERDWSRYLQLQELCQQLLQCRGTVNFARRIGPFQALARETEDTHPRKHPGIEWFTLLTKHTKETPIPNPNAPRIEMLKRMYFTDHPSLPFFPIKPSSFPRLRPFPLLLSSYYS